MDIGPIELLIIILILILLLVIPIIIILSAVFLKRRVHDLEVRMAKLEDIKKKEELPEAL